METVTEEIKKRKGVINENHMLGRWKLTYRVDNSLGAEAFGGWQLAPFIDPISKKKVQMLDGSNNPNKFGYWVDKITTYFMPNKDENLEHYNTIKYLLAHPEVGVEGVVINQRYAKNKKGNPKITLVNLDYEKQIEVANQDIIDLMIGRLSQEGGKYAVSVEKLKYILATLNKPFLEVKHYDNPVALKRVLRTRVKDFVRESKENAQRVETILDNIENAKKVFVIKSLLGTGTLVQTSGSIRLDGQPIGHNIDACVDYLSMNAEVYATLQDILSKSLNEE